MRICLPNRLIAHALTAALSLATAMAAQAQSAKEPAPESVLINADEMSHDNELGVIRAMGTVEVSHQGRTLLADTLIYNQRQDVLTATGSVSLMEPSGDVMFADYMELSGDMKTGVIKALRIRLADRSRIAANQAVRRDGNVTEMDRAVYSPCEPCKKDPARAPLWQVKAQKVIHDKAAQTIEYKDAWIEMAGVPVAYTPYLSHPDPTVKRRSGFLAPSFGGSSDLGVVLRTPYFWNMAPNRDATITPILTGKGNAGMALDYRQLMTDSRIDGKGSAVMDDGSLSGHIDAKGRFDVNDTWRWGFDADATSNDTYRRRYGFPTKTILESRLYTEGFRRRNYASLSTVGFQDLRAGNDAGTTPLVLPMGEFHHVGAPNPQGLRTEMDASMAALMRSDGTDTRRMSLGGGWVLPYIGPAGDVYSLSTTLRGDLYHVNSLVRSGAQSNYSGVSGRLHPEARLEWRYPLVMDQDRVYQVVEPVAAFVVSPYGGNSEKIPNEDSQDFEFDDTNLFSSNHFSGYDRVEGGPRVNYGLKWGLFGAKGGNTTVVVGQSARYKADSTFASGSGLDQRLSDLVGALRVSPGGTFNLQYRTLMSYKNLEPRRNEVRVSAGPPLLNLSANYVFFDRYENSAYPGREEMAVAVGSQLTRYWRGRMSSVRDLSAEGGQRLVALGLVYEDECLEFSSDLSRSFYLDRELKPSDTIMFRLSFKTLGDVSSGVNSLN